LTAAPKKKRENKKKENWEEKKSIAKLAQSQFAAIKDTFVSVYLCICATACANAKLAVH